MRLLAKADLVLCLGTRLNPFGTLPQYDIEYWPAEAKLIQVDIDHRVLGLSRPVDLALMADAGHFATAVLNELKQGEEFRPPNQERIREVAGQKEAWLQELQSWAGASSKLMHPRALLSALAQALPANAVVTGDVGNTCSMSNAYFGGNGPRRFLPALMWGNCGIAYGLALGAKVGNPAAPVFALQGDGAWGISGLSEVMTAVRENIPVIAVVFNNNQWGAEKKNQIDYYDNRFVGTNLANPDFAQLARDMGAQGLRVEHPDQVADAVNQAVKAQAPTVIDAVIDGAAEVLAEPFRRDALQMPIRHLEKFKI
jgi:sulfoacetaldehyde acetyltransferase